MAEGRIDPSGLELKDRVVAINRVAKVVKGGRRFSFTALVVVGDGGGHVGVGLGKAHEVPEAIRKAVEHAKKDLLYVLSGTRRCPRSPATSARGGSSSVRRPGDGADRRRAVRAVLEAAGVQDVLTKTLGSHNPHNVLKATWTRSDGSGSSRISRGSGGRPQETEERSLPAGSLRSPSRAARSDSSRATCGRSRRWGFGGSGDGGPRRHRGDPGHGREACLTASASQNPEGARDSRS